MKNLTNLEKGYYAIRKGIKKLKENDKVIAQIWFEIAGDLITE